jgi:hypothetical protein
MLSPQYKAYVDDTISLVRSFCIKSELNAKLQNTNLINRGYEVSSNPRTWKYYLNLAGLYHESDAPISVVSADTKETIVLSPTVLLDNPLTAVDYGPDGLYHKDLLNKYPLQRQLILRIFNPIDIDKAIEAIDGTLLYANTAFISEREISLIPKVQKWIYAYRNRWDVTSFAVSDPLYPASSIAVMWHCMVTAVINFRLEMCLTPEVCDFHMWAHLGSRYRLDRYKEHLNNKQSLYLYRNIDYLRFHVGKESTMLSLQENITKPTNILANRYDISQSDASLLSIRKPTPLLLKTRYEKSKVDISLQARNEISHAYQITKNSAIHNETDVDRDVPICNKRIVSTVIDTVPTGLVELEITPKANENINNPKQIKLHHWFYTSSTNKSRIIIQMDAGDKGTLSLTDKNSAILFLYVYNILKGGTVDDVIPSVLVNRIVPPVYPAIGSLTQLVPDHIRDAKYISEMYKYNVAYPTLTSIEAFDKFADTVSFNYYRQWLITNIPYNGTDRSILKEILDKMYRPYLCTFAAAGTTFKEWLRYVDIPYAEFGEYDLIQLISSILKNMTGIEIDGSRISSKHAAMISILKLLTSYGIIFVDGVGARASLMYDFPFMDILYSGSEVAEHRKLRFGFDNGKADSALNNAVTEDFKRPVLRRDPTTFMETHIPHGLDIRIPNIANQEHRIELGTPNIMNVTYTVIEV